MFLLAAAISVCAISIIVFGSLTGEKQQVSGGANLSAQAKVAPSPARTIVSPSVSVSSRR